MTESTGDDRCAWLGCEDAAEGTITLTDWQTRRYCDPHGLRLLRDAFGTNPAGAGSR